MNEKLIEKIISILSVEFPFTEQEIKSVYDSVKSFDKTVTICTYAAHQGLGLQQAKSRVFPAGRKK